MKPAAEAWAIVLAAGDGTRLRPLVRLLHGKPLPKQFATLSGARSLLQTTIERLSAVALPQHTMVVVSGVHEALARRQLAEWPDIEIVTQPENRGTALGILLPLARLRQRHPDAAVVISPSDHHVPRPTPFIAGVRAAMRSGGVTLIGVLPDRAEQELGWIVPEPLSGSECARVSRFVEKPDRAMAVEMFRRGALWNTFVIAGQVRELWALVTAHLPLLAAAFECSPAPDAIGALYRRARAVDFSHAVLEKAHALRVACVEGSGWADWGTPERVIDSLRGTPALDPLLRRILDGQRRGTDTPSLASRVEAGIPRSHS